MKRDILFYNAIAKYNESKLLNREQLDRIIAANTFSDALKMLYDYGYSRTQDEDIDAFMAEQIKTLNEYVKSDCPNDSLTRIILNPYYYNNAKVYYRQRFMDIDKTALYAIDDADLRTALADKSYQSLSSFMQECLQGLDATNPDGRTIDIEFARAMQKENLSIAKKSRRRELIGFIRVQTDLNNILTIYRCRRLKRPYEHCRTLLFEGGEISLDYFEGIYSASDSDLIAELETNKYSEFIKSIIVGELNPDLARDKILIEKSLEGSIDLATLSPFLSYYYRRLIEYKVVKMILTCIKNNARDKIGFRLRGLYE